ncbi:MAG TPA: hypothetical protein VMW79_00655, partial [Anaerolineae bacterium]|nr:hypothetical protein [Anaerolineae bacterium]
HAPSTDESRGDASSIKRDGVQRACSKIGAWLTIGQDLGTEDDNCIGWLGEISTAVVVDLEAQNTKARDADKN